jgi:cytochrome c oxidase subunit 2
LIAEGKIVYTKNCAVCHRENGKGMPPAYPALKDGKITTGELKQHMAVVLEGKKGTAMAAFGKLLNNDDIAAVITYERNAWGNNTGDVVMPETVKLARAELKK